VNGRTEWGEVERWSIQELCVQEFFFSFVGKWSYVGLVAVLLAAGLGLPLPEDIPLLAAGWLVYKGDADLHLMIATALFGVLLGDSVLFTMGRLYGMRILEHRFLRRIAKPWLLARAQTLYDDHGAKILFAARFMPGFRAVVFLNAGIFRVPYWKFIAFDGGAALISVPVWIWAGAKFSQHLHHFLGEARIASYVIGGALVLAICAWALWERHHLREKQRLLEAARRGDAARASTAASAPLNAGSTAAPTADNKAHCPAKGEAVMKAAIKAQAAGATGVDCSAGKRAN
jgi:membrane protein DedA with SNARE-associated domain